MEKDAILDLGWELCKIHEARHIFLWLADSVHERSWEAGAEITASRHDPEHISVNLQTWTTCTMPFVNPRGGLN